jgi:hypothetical protein
MVANLHIRTREEVFFLNKYYRSREGGGIPCTFYGEYQDTGKNYAGGLVRGHFSREGIFLKGGEFVKEPCGGSNEGVRAGRHIWPATTNQTVFLSGRCYHPTT